MSGSQTTTPGGAATQGTGDPLAITGEQILQSLGASWDAWSAIAASWQSMLNNRGVPAAQAIADRLLKPASWPDAFAPLWEELQQILALPQFSDLPSLDAKALPSLAPAAELMALANQFVLAAFPLWTQACQRFQAEMAKARADGAPFTSAGDALDAWNNVLDQTLMEFNRSSTFADLQRRLLRAAMGQRNEARKFGERLAQSVDLPTRTEMTDVYRRLHDLHREVHALRREVRAMKQANATPPAPKAARRKGAAA